MGMSQNDEHGTMSEINVTPFVDVMLVLLIIFMVTAPMMTQGVKVEVPTTDPTDSSIEQDDKSLTLSITKEGDFYINKRQFASTEMQKKLEALVKVNPDLEVQLRADAKVSYEKVAQLMTMCANAGITKIGMVTQPGAIEEP